MCRGGSLTPPASPVTLTIRDGTGSFHWYLRFFAALALSTMTTMHSYKQHGISAADTIYTSYELAAPAPAPAPARGGSGTYL